MLKSAASVADVYTMVSALVSPDPRVNLRLSTLPTPLALPAAASGASYCHTLRDTPERTHSSAVFCFFHFCAISRILSACGLFSSGKM